MTTPMLHQLGTVVFRVVGPMEGFERRIVHTYPEHAVVEGRPRIQYIGPDLHRINLQLHWNEAFCVVPEAMRELRDLADRHEAVALTDGSGTVFGRFVVTEIEETIHHTAINGVPLDASARVTLVEAPEEDANRAAAQPATATRQAQRTRARPDRPARPRQPSGPPRSEPPPAATRWGGGFSG